MFRDIRRYASRIGRLGWVENAEMVVDAVVLRERGGQRSVNFVT